MSFFEDVDDDKLIIIGFVTVMITATIAITTYEVAKLVTATPCSKCVESSGCKRGLPAADQLGRCLKDACREVCTNERVIPE